MKYTQKKRFVETSFISSIELKRLLTHPSPRNVQHTSIHPVNVFRSLCHFIDVLVDTEEFPQTVVYLLSELCMSHICTLLGKKGKINIHSKNACILMVNTLQ